MSGVSMRIDLCLGDAIGDELELVTAYVRDELLQLDVASVDFLEAVQPPSSTKASTELAIIGTLLLTAPTSAALSAVVEVLKSWISRSNGRSARLEIDGDIIDIRGLTGPEQKVLIDRWLERHK